jgi:general secretion pathway protein G
MMRQNDNDGFTLIELALVVAIVGILGGLAIPGYLGYLDKARIARSIAEIRHIEKSIKLFYANTEHYPTTLVEIGMDNVLDPWGIPYQYLNLMNLSAAVPVPSGTGIPGGRSNSWSWFAPSTAYAAPSEQGQEHGGGGSNHGNGGNHGGGNGGGGNGGGNNQSSASQGSGNGGSNGNPNGNGSGGSQSGSGGGRKDRFGVSLNSDFDLYSMGKDRSSAASLSTPPSHDDILRANDGDFVGVASDF